MTDIVCPNGHHSGDPEWCDTCGAPIGGADPKSATGPVPVILITYATTEDAVRRALEAVKADKVISAEPQLIRIEKNR